MSRMCTTTPICMYVIRMYIDGYVVYHVCYMGRSCLHTTAAATLISPCPVGERAQLEPRADQRQGQRGFASCTLCSVM
jgi:hypothetical protein